MKVYVVEDEWYPFYFLKEKESHMHCVAIELTEEEFNRYQKAIEEISAASKMIEERLLKPHPDALS